MVANASQKGYYRVMYAPEVLSELDRIAETNLTPAERIGLVNDEWAMVSAGMIPIGDFLSLVEALKNDRRLPVVDAYAGRLGTVDIGIWWATPNGMLPRVGQKPFPRTPPRNWAGSRSW